MRPSKEPPALLIRVSILLYFVLTSSKASWIDWSSSMSSWMGMMSDFEVVFSLLRVEMAALALSRDRLPIKIV